MICEHNGETASHWFCVPYRHYGLRLVAIEQTESTEILTVFALHANLDQIIFEQNTIVLEYESKFGANAKESVIISA